MQTCTEREAESEAEREAESEACRHAESEADLRYEGDLLPVEDDLGVR
jgi:hypothetical protein